jgi:hypothetical protein
VAIVEKEDGETSITNIKTLTKAFVPFLEEEGCLTRVSVKQPKKY